MYSSRRQFLRGGLVLAGLGLLSGCGPVSLPWQQPAKVPVIGVLTPGPREARAPMHAGLDRGLRELGYRDGQNIAIEYRYADSNDRLPDLAAELVDRGVDLIIAGAGTPSAVAAKRASATIPIVFTSVANPVANGLVATLAQPGGNSTGLSILSPALAGKRLELLQAIIPGLSRLAVILNTTNPVHPFLEQELTDAAQAARVQLQALRICSATEYEPAFQTATSARADAIHPVTDSVVTNNRALLAELGLRYRLPTSFEFRENADAGGLLSYGPNLVDMYRRTATYVDRILKGARPADLPVEQPTLFDFIINLRTARALGLTIPNSVLEQATEILQ